MTTISRAAAVANITCEAAPIIASAIARLRHPAALRFTYTTNSVVVTAVSPERLAEAEGPLAVAFAAHHWGITACDSSDVASDRLSFQAPEVLMHAAIYAMPCLYCNGPAPEPTRGCCSWRCAYLEHDKD